MDNFKGVIVEESLESRNVLRRVKILKTDVENVSEAHKTPWLKKWTLHIVEVPENIAQSVALEVSRSLDPNHCWYADFANSKFHFIIFLNKIFKVDKSKPEQYQSAMLYGLSIGIPNYQLDFSPQVK